MTVAFVGRVVVAVVLVVVSDKIDFQQNLSKVQVVLLNIGRNHEIERYSAVVLIDADPEKHNYS